MGDGLVVGIYTTPVGGAPMLAVDEIRAVAGRGLEGDRYFQQTGTFSTKPGPGREVTLIESEAMEALERDYGVKLGQGDARRNIVTRGVPLNHLVGRTFRVGEVVLRGIRLCEPCSHLAQLTADDVRQGLVHRGGLRAEIRTGGIIRVGDAVRVE